MKVRYKGKLYQRIGECKRCGACCFIFGCPHLILTHKTTGEAFRKEIPLVPYPNVVQVAKALKDYFATCAIHDHLAEYCEQCQSTHEPCIVGHDHSDVELVKKGICGFTFVEVKE